MRRTTSRREKKERKKEGQNMLISNVCQAALERIATDPRYHDLLSLVKTARNGAVYGAKVRFPHALVYVMIFQLSEE
jgi:hypothetical protein